MEQIYQKVDKIDELAKEASLPYLGWKVLFLVDKNTDAKEISSLIGEDISSVSEILQSLESKGLIEKVEKVEEKAATVDKVAEPEAASIGDELLIEDESSPAEAEEQPAESIEPKFQAQEITEQEEAVSPESSEEDMVAESEEDVVEKSIVDEEMVVEEDSDETEEEFDLGIDGEFGMQEQTEAETVTETVVAESVEEEAPAQEAVERAAKDEEIISDESRKTIMVIDDSIVIRKMIEIALEEEDFNIITAMSGKEGLETIEKESPNLVILDMMLPDMNGIDVLKTIKTEKNLPVIMLSGKDSPQLIESAKEIGVDDFLPKPFRDEELVEKVKTLIGA